MDVDVAVDADGGGSDRGGGGIGGSDGDVSWAVLEAVLRVTPRWLLGVCSP